MIKFLATAMVAFQQMWEALFSDDEPFDAEWMDAKAWRATRL